MSVIVHRVIVARCFLFVCRLRPDQPVMLKCLLQAVTLDSAVQAAVDSVLGDGMDHDSDSLTGL